MTCCEAIQWGVLASAVSTAIYKLPDVIGWLEFASYYCWNGCAASLGG